MSLAKSKLREVPHRGNRRFYETHVMVLDDVLISSSPQSPLVLLFRSSASATCPSLARPLTWYGARYVMQVRAIYVLSPVPGPRSTSAESAEWPRLLRCIVYRKTLDTTHGRKAPYVCAEVSRKMSCKGEPNPPVPIDVWQILKVLRQIARAFLFHMEITNL
jgi:hypothetical protein